MPLFHSLWVLAPLREPGTRLRVYAGVAGLIFLLALLSVPFKQRFDFINSDGRWYYVYLPSLVVDGDLDFTNQVREHWHNDWHPPLEPRQAPYFTEKRLLKNKYPVGVALTLVPSFLAGHAVALGLHALTGSPLCVPDGYSVPYQVLNLITLLALAALGMRLTDEILTQEFQVNPVFVVLAVVVYWLGSPLLYYSCREPYMSHAPGAFWVACVVYLAWRCRRDADEGFLSLGRLTLLAFVTSLAVLCRPTNVMVAPFHLWLIIGIVRAGLLGRLLLRLPVALCGLAPLGVQLLVWHGLYGRWVHYSYEQEGFNWTQPVLWQSLFSSRHGLFFWSPLLLPAVLGLFAHARHPGRSRQMLACFAVSFLLLWYFNSSWRCWYFGESFGARAYLELSCLFVVGLAGAFQAVRRAGPWTRRAFVTGLVLALAYHVALFTLYNTHMISRGDYLF